MVSLCETALAQIENNSYAAVLQDEIEYLLRKGRIDYGTVMGRKIHKGDGRDGLPVQRVDLV